MNKQEKNQMIDSLAEKLDSTSVFYITDTSELTVENTNKLRRNCFKKDIELKVVKNTIVRKALEKIEGKDYSELYDVLKGPTSIMFSSIGNAPAKVIEEFRKKNEKPLLKAAYVEEAIYVGDDQLKALSNIKSREELIGDIILLLQSPAKNVVSALQSGGNILSGLVKAMAERQEN